MNKTTGPHRGTESGVILKARKFYSFLRKLIDLVRVLNLCDKLAQKRGDNFISSELFVLAALESRGTLADILKAAGATTANITQAIEQMRGGESVNDQGAEDQRQALKKYTIDLTERAEQGKLDRSGGRFVG